MPTSGAAELSIKMSLLGLVVLPLILFSGLVESFNLTLIHTNDVHAHFTEFNAFGGRCVDKLKAEKKCFGGFPRQVTKVKEIRSTNENVLFLNGGDFYQGTVWYTLHRWNIEADLVNTLGIDAMSLGNHEFDDGLKGLFPYLRNLKTKVVVCNINSSKVPEFAELVHPSTILEIGGQKIGIIGYLTPETKFLSSTGDLEFEDEVECIKREAHRLATEEGLNKIFAVGHSGFAVDQKIAKEVPEIDIVVGGHTNTFLYTGSPPSVEEPQGPYPVVVEREDGSKALVVQDFAFGKYMGHLQVLFDEEGRVQEWSGNPILLDASVPEDQGILDQLEPYGQEVKRRVRQSVGRTNVLLRGDRLTCRMKECNLGNFLADASLDYFVEQPTEKGWNFVAVALWNSGGIRSSIDERMNQGNITFEDVITVAPFGNTMDVVALKGKILRQVLEKSMRDYDLDSIDPPGSFLQVSGLRLTYNVSNRVGSRLTEACVRCADCRVPKYLPLEEESVYWVVMNTYMAKGGDGFDVIAQNAVANRNTDELDVDIIIKYVQKYSPVITGLEGRIKVVSSRDSEPTYEATVPPTIAEIPSKIPLAGTPASEVSDDTEAFTMAHPVVLGEVPPPGADESSAAVTAAPTEKPVEDPKTTGSPLSYVMDSVSDASDIFITELQQGVGDRFSSEIQGVGDRLNAGTQGAAVTAAPTEKPVEDPKTTGSPLSYVMDSVSDASDIFITGLQGVGDRFSSGIQGVGDRLNAGTQGVRDRFSAGTQGVGNRLNAGMQGVGDRLQGVGDKLKKIPERIPVLGKIWP